MPAKTIQDLPEDSIVSIRRTGNRIKIEALRPDGSPYYSEGAIAPLFVLDALAFTDPVSGREIWLVDGTWAEHGFGPLVYDIALELASLDGRGGLMTGTGTNAESGRVWEYYRDHRPDVSRHDFEPDHPWWSKKASDVRRPYIDPTFPFLLRKPAERLHELKASGKVRVGPPAG